MWWGQSDYWHPNSLPSENWIFNDNTDINNIAYSVGSSGPGLGQAQTCDGVNPTHTPRTRIIGFSTTMQI